MCGNPPFPDGASSPGRDALSLDSQLCFRLYAAARRVIGLYQPILEPLGLTYTQYLVLMALWDEDRLSVKALGDRLHLDSGTLSPLLKKLEGRRLLTRERSRNDERSVTVRLTEEGRGMKERARDIPGRIAACLPMEPERLDALRSLLDLVIEG